MCTGPLTRAVLFAALATLAACGGRGLKPDAGDGGRDASGTEVAAVDGAPPGTDAAPDHADATPPGTDAAPDRADTAPGVDTAVPSAPICVSKPGAAPACGEALCGNGKRESCAVKACNTDGTISFPVEACDGADLDGVSCVGDGYGSGVVTCNSSCALERARCQPCLALDTTLVACDEARLPTTHGREVQLATTDTAVAVAWEGGEGPVGHITGTLSVARLSPTLEILGVTTIKNAEPTPEATGSMVSAALVPLGTGWLVGGVADVKAVVVHRIDAAGQDLGRVTLDTVGDDVPNPFLRLVARPTGGALALWLTAQGIRAAPIAADGTVGARTTLSLAGLTNVFPTNAVWLAGAVYMITPLAVEATWTNETRLIRFGADGSAPVFVKTILDEATGRGTLTADADELLFSYGSGFSNAMLLGRFDTTGAPTAAPFDTRLQVQAVVPAGDDALVVTSDPNAVTLGLERHTRAGALVGERRGIIRVPNTRSYIVDYTAARRGPDTIVAWLNGISTKTDVGLARLAQ